MKKRRTELSTTGRVVALVAAVLLASFVSSVAWLRDASSATLDLVFWIARVAIVVVGSISIGAFWDRVTGSKPEEVRGRRSWTNDPVVQKVQSMEETHMLVAALVIAFMLFGGIIAMWQGGMHLLAGVMSAMAVVSALLAWLLTRKKRPYRLRDRHKDETPVQTRRELNESMPWTDE